MINSSGTFIHTNYAKLVNLFGLTRKCVASVSLFILLCNYTIDHAICLYEHLLGLG